MPSKTVVTNEDLAVLIDTKTNRAVENLAIIVKQGFDSMHQHMDQRFLELERRLDTLECRLDTVEQRLDGIEAEISAIRRQLQHAVYQHEFDALAQRVEILERKAGIRTT